MSGWGAPCWPCVDNGAVLKTNVVKSVPIILGGPNCAMYRHMRLLLM